MRLSIAVLAALFCAVAARADDLDDFNAKCVAHKIATPPSLMRARPSGWEPGWEHCETIVSAWAARKSKQDAADETKNPDLKASRDYARKLNEETQ